MANVQICVPHARRRKNRWLMKLGRYWHLVIWVGAIVFGILVLGYSAYRFVKRQQSEQATAPQYQIRISGSFMRERK